MYESMGGQLALINLIIGAFCEKTLCNKEKEPQKTAGFNSLKSTQLHSSTDDSEHLRVLVYFLQQLRKCSLSPFPEGVIVLHSS